MLYVPLLAATTVKKYLTYFASALPQQQLQEGNKLDIR
jgi:hypothetical protein